MFIIYVLFLVNLKYSQVYELIDRVVRFLILFLKNMLSYIPLIKKQSHLKCV